MIFNPILKKTIVNSAEPESATVDLDMKNGDQVITPSDGKLLDKVTITKPTTLLPDNIKKGVRIAGVLGEYENPTEELSVTENGEYTPPAGKHFSKVTVNVEATNGGTSEDLAAELTEQDELLTQIEALLDGSGGDSGSSGDFATLTVNLAEEYEEYDEETDESWMTYTPRAYSGYYSVDGGEAVYFENESALPIEASVGSVVRIFISEGSTSYEYGTCNAVGCNGDYRCEEEGHTPWEEYPEFYEAQSHCGEFGCPEGAVIVITASTASITVYECYC